MTTSEHALLRTNIDLAMFLDLGEHTFKKASYRDTEADGTKYSGAVSGTLDVTDTTKSDNTRGSSASSSWQAPVARGAPTATSTGSVLRRKFTLPPVRGLNTHLLSGQMPSSHARLGHGAQEHARVHRLSCDDSGICEDDFFGVAVPTNDDFFGLDAPSTAIAASAQVQQVPPAAPPMKGMRLYRKQTVTEY